MKLYLINAENIYFPQIKTYFREIISSYDNGNYRSAIVMLYSTVVCDLLLKLKELTDVYSDQKAEKMLDYVEKQKRAANKSAWEWELIGKIYKETELLSDESYTMLQHIYDLRNFSAHPALNDDYELISPTPEMTVAYIKKALEDILIKPSVFAQSIVSRMSDDLATKRALYLKDFEALELYLNKVYFQRMTDKMITQVFRAFWKFTFIKTEDALYDENRGINRKALEAMLNAHGETICRYIKENPAYFTVSLDKSCLSNICVLLGYYPQIYIHLEQQVQYQIQTFDEGSVAIIKWFEGGDLAQHITIFDSDIDKLSSHMLTILQIICQRQGQPSLFVKFLINHYSRSNSYASARIRFEYVIEPYMESFSDTDFENLICVISSNDQIYNYAGQKDYNDRIMEQAATKLSPTFDLSRYTNFEYLKPEEVEIESTADEGETMLEVEPAIQE